MPSRATTTYASLLNDVETLVSLHSGSGAPGRPTGNNEPLLRAAVVLLVTAWENYIEQAVEESFDHVLTQIGDDPRLLSGHLQGVIQKEAVKSAWSITGDGWRTVAQGEVESLVSDLNNAASGQVDGLVAKVFGIPAFLDNVSWQNKAAASVRDDLRSLVNDVRGEIVHKGTTPSALNLAGFTEWKNFMAKLVVRVDAVLASQVQSSYGSPPWVP
jgi:hypothetical protein